MALVEISNFPGTPKLRCRVPNGTLFYDWLAANDATFHRDLLIVRNGVKLGDDDELAFELSELDHIQIFDQPKGIVGDILSPIFKVVGQVFSFLAPKPAIANNGGNTVDSPNNSLTGQTNTARVYKAKPDIYGQIRSFPDLIQESVFEYVHQTSTDGGLKYVTEWMCIGIGKYDYESVRYSESSLGSLAGAEFQFFQPGEVIPQIVEGYGFDDVDGQEVPGQNEASDFPIETATANTVVSGTYSGGQIAMKIVKQAEFDYFMGLVLPHAVTFTINVTYSTASGTVTTDATFSGTLISAVETNDGAVVNPVRWWLGRSFPRSSQRSCGFIPSPAWAGRKRRTGRWSSGKLTTTTTRYRERNRPSRTDRRRRTSRRVRCFIALTRSLRPEDSGNTR